MAAVTVRERIVVRAPSPGEGTQIASLWRELWEAHERWGGYPGTRDDRVYARLASRLDEDARVRGGQPVLGRHIHLIAAIHGQVCGQVEGWFERHGAEPRTPFTCEVRSLIVHPRARVLGVGRALLTNLARTASDLARGAPTVLAAEVLEPNPAHSFYQRLGYHPVAWSTRMVVSHEPRVRSGEFVARPAEPQDALALAVLESMLAARRRAAHDERFDRPRAIDATLVGAIAAHLGRRHRDVSEPHELVTVDARGDVRAAASLVISPLDPPFARTRRTILGRFAIDPAREPLPVLAPLIALACRYAIAAEAPTMELTDLTFPGTALYDATVTLGADPWSRIVTRMA
ncbi:GNAT family N-acetyltransferase [Pendulispora albinea]|uniref:GNAT family N-acetyltransferase n=1 Tax=Pendulispora albinea TaxID=2741071 RepID=A0ABZ2M2C6_9BACT